MLVHSGTSLSALQALSHGSVAPSGHDGTALRPLPDAAQPGTSAQGSSTTKSSSATVKPMLGFPKLPEIPKSILVRKELEKASNRSRCGTARSSATKSGQSQGLIPEGSSQSQGEYLVHRRSFLTLTCLDLWGSII